MNDVYFFASRSFAAKVGANLGHSKVVPQQFATPDDRQPTNAIITAHPQARLVMQTSKALRNVLIDHDLPFAGRCKPHFGSKSKQF